MAKYRVFRTTEFEADFEKLELFNKKRIEGFLDQLLESALFVGKPLGFKWFREKKFNGNRMYFLVYEE
mgnify:CR=1 FL=1